MKIDLFRYEYPAFSFFDVNNMIRGKPNDAYFYRNLKMERRATFYDMLGCTLMMNHIENSSSFHF